MFVRVAAAREAPSGKAAKARHGRASEDSLAGQESDAAVAPASFFWSLRNVLLSPTASYGQPDSGKAGKPGLPRQPGIQPLPMQTKLEVGTVDDPLERQADRAADLVTRMPAPGPASAPDGSAKAHTANSPVPGHAASLQRKCACGGTCDKCKSRGKEDEQEKAQPGVQPTGSSPVSRTAPAIVHEVLSEPGEPLDAATRAFFEPRFEWDFSRVRVHSGARAAASARAVNARAYTVGNHIVFRNHEFHCGGTQGRTLVAHELAHVIQQGAGSSAAHGAGAPLQSQQSPQSMTLRRKPADQPDEPLDVALDRQDTLERIAEQVRSFREQLDTAEVDIAERETKVAPFFVQEDAQVQRMEQQIASGRTQVPARLAKLNENLRVVAKEALKESDDLDQLRARIAFVEQMNSFMPALLVDTSKYEALLKEQKSGEKDHADTLAFFEGIRKEIETTKRFLPERAAYMKQRSQYLEAQARSEATTAKVKPDKQVSTNQLELLRTIIESSPTLSPYLTEERARGSQPTDLRNARNFVIHSSDSKLQKEAQQCNQGTAGPGKKIGGFYCRQTDTIHLPPDAKFGTALHEAIHKYSKIDLRNQCGIFLNEGLTQYFADIVLTDRRLPKFTGHAYQNQLACATRFISRFHLEEVAPAYFLGAAGLGAQRLKLLAGHWQCRTFCAGEQRAEQRAEQAAS